MREGSPRDTVEMMYESFVQIYGMSAERGNEAYARKILEHDVELLGYYFGLVDPLDQKAGFSLLAECIAYLRMRNSPIAVDSVIEEHIESIFQELSTQPHHVYPINPDDPPDQLISHLKSLTFSHDLLRGGYISKEQDHTLRECFIQLANFFLLRDGNVTGKEMLAINAFEHQILGDDHA